MSRLRLFTLVLTGFLAARNGVAKECVDAHSTEVIPFSGQWHDDDGNTMTIRPGYFSFLRAERRAKDDEPTVTPLVPRAELASLNDARVESWDCRTLDRTGIEQLVKDIEAAADAAIVPRPKDVQAEIDRTRAVLSRPSYPIIEVIRYETGVIYLLLDENNLLEIDFNLAGFGTTRFVRVEPDESGHPPR